MNTRSALLVAAVAAAAACGAQPEAAPAPAPVPLGYSVPAVNPVMYSSQDTARINIEVQPGMSMDQTMGQNSTVRLSFAPDTTGGGLAVTATWVDFSAFMESSMMPRQEVGAEALAGDFELRVSPEGEVEQVSGPELPDEVQQLSMGGDNMFVDFFLRLPNRVVQPGESWSDTVRVDEENEGARSVNETVVTSTLRGDTTVAGRRLWVINSTKTTHVLVEGNMQGMDMRNELNGTINETSLWDPARRMLHSSSSTGSMTGVVSIPNAGMNDIPITVTNTRRITLVESTQAD